MLSEMGMPSAFDPGKADFSGMNGKRDLFIVAAVHKAFVDVNEEGTEAAAATAWGWCRMAVVPRGTADLPCRPPLPVPDPGQSDGEHSFLGRVMNPKA